MEPLQIYERFKGRFGERVLETIEKGPDPFAVVDPAALVEICHYLREDPELAMDPRVDSGQLRRFVQALEDRSPRRLHASMLPVPAPASH